MWIASVRPGSPLGKRKIKFNHWRRRAFEKRLIALDVMAPADTRPMNRVTDVDRNVSGQELKIDHLDGMNLSSRNG